VRASIWIQVDALGPANAARAIMDLDWRVTLASHVRSTRAPVRLYGLRLTRFTRVRRDSHHDVLSCHAGDWHSRDDYYESTSVWHVFIPRVLSVSDRNSHEDEWGRLGGYEHLANARMLTIKNGTCYDY